MARNPNGIVGGISMIDVYVQYIHPLTAGLMRPSLVTVPRRQELSLYRQDKRHNRWGTPVQTIDSIDIHIVGWFIDLNSLLEILLISQCFHNTSVS